MKDSKMKVIDATEDAGSKTKASEDRLGHAGNLAWVIDGASDFTNEKTLPGLSNVHWLVDYVQRQLFELGAEYVDVGGQDLIETLSSGVRREMGKYDLGRMRNYPVCSIGLIIDHSDYVELARVGDATVLFNDESQVVEVSTPFFDRREAAAVHKATEDGLNREDVLAAMFKRRHEYITGDHGESVFSGHPKAVLHVHSKVVGYRVGEAMSLICTDGLSRAVTEYHLYQGWNELMDDACANSLDSVVLAVREHEHGSREDIGQSRFKKSDDIAAILLQL
jgi:hypothetical protein